MTQKVQESRAWMYHKAKRDMSDMQMKVLSLQQEYKAAMKTWPPRKVRGAVMAVIESTSKRIGSLENICTRMHLSKDRIWAEIVKDPVLVQAYENAKMNQAWLLVDDIFRLEKYLKNKIETDENYRNNKAFVEFGKLQMENRKWLAGKFFPKKFGAHIDISGTPVNVNVLQQIFKPAEISREKAVVVGDVKQIEGRNENNS